MYINIFKNSYFWDSFIVNIDLNQMTSNNTNIMRETLKN